MHPLFILEAVESTRLDTARVNVRGDTGDAPYPPSLMLARLISVG